MSWPSLDVGAAAWRAAQAAGWLSASLQGAPGDDVLDGLGATGEPPDGWWSIIAALRAEPHAVRLALPRPGDPRGVPALRSADVEGAVGCLAARHGWWLMACADGTWTRVDADGPPPPPTGLGEADSGLRRALVAAAHALDDAGANPFGAGLPPAVDRTVDGWLASPVPVDPLARRTAATALRMVMATSAAVAHLDATGITAAGDADRRRALASLEPAARSALEAAYSYTVDAG